MGLFSAFQLILLAAIWGASFLFMRIAVPVLGPAWLMEARVGLAAVFLLIVAVYLKHRLDWKSLWRHYLFLGLVNTALPFLLFAYAAQTLTASVLSILNSTAPIWGTLFTAIWFRNTISPRMIVGLIMGVVGVAILLSLDVTRFLQGSTLAIIAGISAAACYGIASVYASSAKQNQSKDQNPFNNAHGSMWAATFIILPVLTFFPVQAEIDIETTWSVILLGILCTGFAYILYFRLIEDIGPASALSVTFLIPVFGIFWGYWYLDEVIGWHTLIGTALVVSGTIFVTNFRFTKVALANS